MKNLCIQFLHTLVVCWFTTCRRLDSGSTSECAAEWLFIRRTEVCITRRGRKRQSRSSICHKQPNLLSVRI